MRYGIRLVHVPIIWYMVHDMVYGIWYMASYCTCHMVYMVCVNYMDTVG